jgi:y4mF family transcriptional regulator
MDIGMKVAELRKGLKLTQPELARRAGVGLRFLRDLEQGKATVRLDKLNQVLKFFGHHLEVIKDERK